MFLSDGIVYYSVYSCFDISDVMDMIYKYATTNTMN